ncbi:Rne/Rng family ribonuclease [Azospirillum halopraeferens]|uniref:Rne/Rng family ribonuclease n=1 Tax=Azospirillum halopraeferens TaxID=34010 RepID=UPI00048E4F31|nr:ribonuclease E/G [Azospirillum halopraeferens]
MTKRMLIDATHPEETRVAVLNGNKLEDLDFEIASRKQLKGNIYLAKVTRVEPSLQAAFVEYGGNRHGFLAFSEIHPDYYRIPMADRQALLAEERRLSEQAEARAEREADESPDEADERGRDTTGEGEGESDFADAGSASGDDSEVGGSGSATLADAIQPDELSERVSPMPSPIAGPDGDDDETGAAPTPGAGENLDVVGGDDAEDARRRRARPLRSYKIQEVIKRRQIMLVQVTKEERGNKGAALTTYLSLPGRFCVLMPNTGRGGGISRKITNPADRKRLKEILSDLDIPDGMAVILRTAGLERSRQEIKRDLEYLLRLWDDIREQTLKSSAPCLIYEEANLIKRAIRDLYADDIDEMWVEGETGFNTARDFMRMLMPTHTKRVQLYRNEQIPLFHRYQVEGQIDAIHSPVVQLRSGGYIVINPTEALVAIDVNSGKSTRERNIEETAFKTNLEAAEEVARQLRLRDLAGLIVIDFIDMEESRNNAAVERRLKEAMKTDRARIQLGRISPFGLMELSRQRLRPSLLETNFERCPHCSGTGVIRSVESSSLHVLRAIEEEGIRKRSAEITVAVPTAIALYILNQKRNDLIRIEAKYGFRVQVQADDTLIAPELRLERVKARQAGDEGGPLVSADRVMAETDRQLAAEAEEAETEAREEAETAEEPGEATAEAGETGDQERRRRRRRRRGRNRDREGPETRTGMPGEGEAAEAAGEGEFVDAPGEAEAAAPDEAATGDGEEGESAEFAGEDDAEGDAARKKRRRGKRGGRRRARREEGLPGETAGEGEEAEAAGGVPQPANPEPAPAANLEPIDFDWILTGESPAADEPTAPAQDNAPVEADVAEEANVAAADAEAEPEAAAETPPVAAAEAKPKARRKAPAKAAAAKAAPAEAKAEAKPVKAAKAPARSRKKAAEPVEAPQADLPVTEPAAAEEAPKPKKAPARSRKKAAAAAEAPQATLPAESAAPAEEAPKPKKAPARSRKKAAAAAEAPQATLPAEPATPDAGDTAAPEPEAAAADSGDTTPQRPRRGWWAR